MFVYYEPECVMQLELPAIYYLQKYELGLQCMTATHPDSHQILLCARVVWGWPFGVAWLGPCAGGSAWAGVAGAAHGLGLGLLVGGQYVF